MHSFTTDNVMRPTCPTNVFAAPNRMQEPPSGSRLNHLPDPEVHGGYLGSVHDLCSLF